MSSLKDDPTLKALRKLNLRQFCKEGRQLEAKVGLSEMPRLRDSLFEAQGDEAYLVKLDGYEDTQRTGKREQRLDLQVSGHAALQCQRCLEKMLVKLASASSFVLVASEADADAMEAAEAKRMQDDEADDEAIDTLNEPEPLVTAGTTDVIALLEDELLLSLPIVPMHEQCPVPLQANPSKAVSENHDEQETKQDKPNPFAVLASLKGKGNKPH